MLMIDDLVESYGALNQSARAWLRERGVPHTAMIGWPGLIGVADIEVHALDMFSFAEVGAKAFVHPVYSGGIYSEPIDIVAWLPADPSSWWTLCRTGHPLGDDALHYAEFWSEPVLLHPHPLAWLAAEGDGVVVNDWIMSSPALRSVPTIITDDHEFGREVRRRLTMPARTCPEIRVRVERVAA